MTWLATAPYGALPQTTWTCEDCPEMDAGSDADAMRAAAKAHVETAGHTVHVARGTLEMLCPMATVPGGAP